MRKSFTTLLLFSAAVCFGQDTTIKQIKAHSTRFIFARNHFSFVLMPNITQNARITPVSGHYHLGSTNTKGLEAGFTYQFNFDQHYSASVGLHGRAAGRNFTLRIPKEDFNPPQQQDYIDDKRSTISVDMYLNAPITAQRRWFVSNKQFFDITAGINICFYPDDIGEFWSMHIQNPTGGFTKIANIELEVNHSFKPWVDYTAGAGYAWILRNHNIIRAGFQLTYSNVGIANGTYTINVPGKPASSGNYHSRLSYAGIAISYSLTGTQKAIRRIYEKAGRNLLEGK